MLQTTYRAAGISDWDTFTQAWANTRGRASHELGRELIKAQVLARIAGSDPLSGTRIEPLCLCPDLAYLDLDLVAQYLIVAEKWEDITRLGGIGWREADVDALIHKVAALNPKTALTLLTVNLGYKQKTIKHIAEMGYEKCRGHLKTLLTNTPGQTGRNLRYHIPHTAAKIIPLEQISSILWQIHDQETLDFVARRYLGSQDIPPLELVAKQNLDPKLRKKLGVHTKTLLTAQDPTQTPRPADAPLTLALAEERPAKERMQLAKELDFPLNWALDDREYQELTSTPASNLSDYQAEVLTQYLPRGGGPRGTTAEMNSGTKWFYKQSKNHQKTKRQGIKKAHKLYEQYLRDLTDEKLIEVADKTRPIASTMMGNAMVASELQRRCNKNTLDTFGFALAHMRPLALLENKDSITWANANIRRDKSKSSAWETLSHTLAAGTILQLKQTHGDVAVKLFIGAVDDWDGTIDELKEAVTATGL